MGPVADFTVVIPYWCSKTLYWIKHPRYTKDSKQHKRAAAAKTAAVFSDPHSCPVCQRSCLRCAELLSHCWVTAQALLLTAPPPLAPSRAPPGTTAPLSFKRGSAPGDRGEGGLIPFYIWLYWYGRVGGQAEAPLFAGDTLAANQSGDIPRWIHWLRSHSKSQPKHRDLFAAQLLKPAPSFCKSDFLSLARARRITHLRRIIKIHSQHCCYQRSPRSELQHNRSLYLLDVL